MDRYDFRHAIYRGLWHLFGGVIIVTATILLPKTLVLIYLSLATVVFLSLELLRFRFRRLNDWFLKNFRFVVRNKEKSSIVGSTYILLSAVFVIAVFTRELAALAVLFLSVGDPFATVVGGIYGRTRINGPKSLQGSTAFLLSCLVFGFTVQMITHLPVTFQVIIVGSLAATLSEAFSFGVNDNITVPIISATVMWLFQLL